MKPWNLPERLNDCNRRREFRVKRLIITILLIYNEIRTITIENKCNLLNNKK